MWGILVSSRGPRERESETITYTVPAIHCAHCAMSIREEVSEIEGVEDVDVDVDSKLVTVKGLELDDRRPPVRDRRGGVRVA